MSCRSCCSERGSPQPLVSFSCFPWIGHGVFRWESHLKEWDGLQGSSRGVYLSQPCLVPQIHPNSTNSPKINPVVPQVGPVGIFLGKEEIQPQGVLNGVGGRKESPHSVSDSCTPSLGQGSVRSSGWPGTNGRLWKRSSQVLGLTGAWQLERSRKREKSCVLEGWMGGGKAESVICGGREGGRGQEVPFSPCSPRLHSGIRDHSGRSQGSVGL